MVYVTSCQRSRHTQEHVAKIEKKRSERRKRNNGEYAQRATKRVEDWMANAAEKSGVSRHIMGCLRITSLMWQPTIGGLGDISGFEFRKREKDKELDTVCVFRVLCRFSVTEACTSRCVMLLQNDWLVGC